jgi:hypothetical protein
MLSIINKLLLVVLPVQAEPVHAGDSGRSATTQTGEGGKFDLAPIPHLRVIPIPMDVTGPPPTAISISAAKYRPFQQSFGLPLSGTTIKLESGP